MRWENLLGSRLAKRTLGAEADVGKQEAGVDWMPQIHTLESRVQDGTGNICYCSYLPGPAVRDSVLTIDHAAEGVVDRLATA